MKNPLTLEAFADWLEKQPEDEAYLFSDAAVCALTEYARSIGFDANHTDDRAPKTEGAYVAICKTPDPRSEIGRLPIEVYSVVQQPPHTFGAVALRARAALQTPTTGEG